MKVYLVYESAAYEGITYIVGVFLSETEAKNALKGSHHDQACYIELEADKKYTIEDEQDWEEHFA